jgi:hypothetical protein
MYERKPVASIHLGPLSADILYVQEEARRLGCLAISGTVRLFAIPFTFLTSDYFVWGEEMVGAASYLSDDPEMKATLRGNDVARFLALAVFVIAAILYNVGITGIIDLLQL